MPGLVSATCAQRLLLVVPSAHASGRFGYRKEGIDPGRSRPPS